MHQLEASMVGTIMSGVAVSQTQDDTGRETGAGGAPRYQPSAVGQDPDRVPPRLRQGGLRGGGTASSYSGDDADPPTIDAGRHAPAKHGEPNRGARASVAPAASKFGPTTLATVGAKPRYPSRLSGEPHVAESPRAASEKRTIRPVQAPSPAAQPHRRARVLLPRAAKPAWRAHRPSAKGETGACRGNRVAHRRQAGRHHPSGHDQRQGTAPAQRHRSGARSNDRINRSDPRLAVSRPASGDAVPADDRADWRSHDRTTRAKAVLVDVTTDDIDAGKAIGFGVSRRQFGHRRVDFHPGGANPGNPSGQAQQGGAGTGAGLQHMSPARAGTDAASRTGSIPLRNPTSGWR